MSYIGTKPTSSFGTATSQTFTGNNSLTEFTLNRRVSAPEDLEVFVSNVQQQPTESYTIGSNGLTLTFSEAPPSGQFYVVYRTEVTQSALDPSGARTSQANTFTENQTFSGNVDINKLLTVDQDTASQMVSSFEGLNGRVHIGRYGHILQQNTNDSTTNFWTTATRNSGNFEIGYGTSTTDGVVSSSIIIITTSGATSISGDLTVDSGTLKVDSSNNRVGIGTTSPAVQLHIDEGTSNSYGTLRLEGNNRGGDIEMYQGTVPVSTIRTDQSGNMYFKTSGAYGSSSLSNKLEIPTAGGLKVRNAAATGPILDIGTTSTSVADDGVMGGIDFSSGASSTVNARLHAKQYGTSENAGYFSNELRAPNGNSLGEVSREFISQNAHGGIYIKRPMPANIFYYREVYKSVNIAASQSGTTFITLNQNDYYCSIACFVDFWTLDTNYPTSALMRRYGLTANTHQGRSSWSARLTQYLDMGEYNTGSTDHSSASVNASLSIHTTKSAGSNNGYLYIRYNTGSYTEASATVRLQGMFLNTRFDDQTITANL